MILGLTTATPRCTVALVSNGRVLASKSYEDEMNHAERIFGTLDALLAEAERQKSEIATVACDVGPGSFTGVRVGLSSAKGIALGLGVPLVGVGSLEAMCAAALERHEAGVACALIDAKRGETFVAAYGRDGRERLTPRHTNAGRTHEALSFEGDDVIYCGRAAEREGVSPILHHATCELPSAEWIARLAAQREPTTVDLVEPMYVRAPDAKPMVACETS